MIPLLKTLLAILTAFIVFILIVYLFPSPPSSDQVKADPEMPYRMTYHTAGIAGVHRYENQETVCYTWHSQSISCTPKSKDGSLSTY